GYIYLSYEDTASYRDECAFYKVEEYDPDRRIYQYDNLIGFSYIYQESGTSFANVFTALGDETLTDVAAFMFDRNVDYTLSVYTDCAGDDPTSGVQVVYQTGNFGNYGYRNIKLDAPVTLSPGQRYSVILTLDNPDSNYIDIPVVEDVSFWDMDFDHGVYEDSAYLLMNGFDEWSDVSDMYNFRVKAFTQPADSRCPYSPSGTHSYSDWTYTGTSACTEPGSVSRICAYCGKTETGTAAPLGHSWGEWTVDENDDSKLYRVCLRCGATEEKQNVITEDDLIWTFDERTGELTISGDGPMADYSQNMAPWMIHYFDIRSVVIGDGVTSVGSEAFRFYPSIQSISLGSGIKSIGQWAFSGCTSLMSIEIPSGVESIGEAAFYNCSSLMEITVPGSVGAIDQWVFYGCTSLERVYVGNGVSSIGFLAFSGCTSLSCIDLPGTLTSVAIMSFDGCTALSDIYFHGTEEQWNRIDIDICNDPLLRANIHFIGSKLEKTGGYDVKITGLDPALAYVIRYATGEYANAGEVKRGLNAGFIQVSGASEAVITLPTHGMHTVCAVVGSEQKFIDKVSIDVGDMKKKVEIYVDDLNLRVFNLYGATRVNIFKDGGIIRKITSFTTDGLKSWADIELPEAGIYTVRVMFGNEYIETILTATVPAASISTNGRIFTLADYGVNNVSYMRLAKGVVTTAAAMKSAPDLRTYGRKYFTAGTSAFAALDTVNGETTSYTVQIVYFSGYSEFITFDLTPTVPVITTAKSSIILSNVRSEDYYIDWVRCAPGVQTSLYAVRHANGSRVRTTYDIVNDTITFSGLSAGAYTLYYLYDGFNLSEGMVTVNVK
ncbi:MAG: leucine-rich repeat protein, partial [Clostridia bacterium]|nr:leucine-rich repeat protein [Clostridia bacterium]